MLELFSAFLCAMGAAALYLVVRSYEYYQITELKRQARSGNRMAKQVYEIRGAYPHHVLVLLWSLIGLLISTTMVLMQGRIWPILAVVIMSVMVVVTFMVLPRFRYLIIGIKLASVTAPVVKRILVVTKPLYVLLDKVFYRLLTIDQPRHLHSKEELLEVLHNTKLEGVSFSKDEVDIAIHALTFGDHKITEIMTPKSVVKTVRASDVLSPVLLGELHDSGYSRFPVQESERGEFVGVLYSKDLSDLRANKVVNEVMRPELYYVNEFTSLDNVLNAFLRTQHHLFLVVNEFEEVVGIITIEDVLEQIIGRKIVDEFDQYADLRAVAKQLARRNAQERHGEMI